MGLMLLVVKDRGLMLDLVLEGEAANRHASILLHPGDMPPIYSIMQEPTGQEEWITIDASYFSILIRIFMLDMYG